MEANSKSSNNAKPSGGLNVVQRLDLYQIIAYAEGGDMKRVIGRARQMLADAKAVPLKLSSEHLAQIESILAAARAAAQPSAPQDQQHREIFASEEVGGATTSLP